MVLTVHGFRIPAKLDDCNAHEESTETQGSITLRQRKSFMRFKK